MAGTDLVRQLGNGDSTYAHHMKDARFTIPSASLLAKVVVLLDNVPMATTIAGVTATSETGETAPNRNRYVFGIWLPAVVLVKRRHQAPASRAGTQ